MFLRTAILAAAAALSATIAVAAPRARDVTMPDGRRYVFIAPEGVERPPLILALHGGGGSPEQFMRSSRLAEAALPAGFAVAFPAGSGRSRLLTWNGGYCCGYAAARGIDDVAFLTRVIADAADRFRIDPARVYVTGMSNGAIMAQTFAAAAPPGTVRGVASVAGTLDLSGPRPTRPVPLLHIQGTADDRVPYEGGVGAGSRVRTDFTAAEDAIAAFLAPFGGGLASGTRIIDPVADGMRTERTEWRRPDGGPAVVRMKVIGGGHDWPGSARSLRGGGTRDFDASREVVTFFRQLR